METKAKNTSDERSGSLSPTQETPLLLLGFRPLKVDKIHLRCPKCGRKQSNMPRAEFDPPNAVLAELHCPKCANGDKDSSTDYYDAAGVYVVEAMPA